MPQASGPRFSSWLSHPQLGLACNTCSNNHIMYFSIASLAIGLATACIVNAIPIANPNIVTAPDSVNGTLVPPKGPEILWSYVKSRTTTNPVEGDHATAKSLSKSLVNEMLKDYGAPFLSSESPEFVGNPNRFSFRISSTVPIGSVTCPCFGKVRMDLKAGKGSLDLRAFQRIDGKVLKNWKTHQSIPISFPPQVD
ncbi:hypothetical protein C8J55DRAFT_567357 [Lentinula edodes]|uniref:Uncharacterized protein n=1 Tax=Lentinula lateritia TaxID=40482 RepID=A0A9W9DDH7_9AGAR|nr:hypothetical protein C8J55DRAFT_567357 [Lentinula edodes]